MFLLFSMFDLVEIPQTSLKVHCVVMGKTFSSDENDLN